MLLWAMTLALIAMVKLLDGDGGEVMDWGVVRYVISGINAVRKSSKDLGSARDSVDSG